jgi:LysM repeat protein
MSIFGELDKGSSTMKRTATTLGVLMLLAAVLTAGAPGLLRVHPGDTLSGLARAHHTTVAALKRANHLTGDTIYVGELLRVPGNDLPAGASAAPRRTVSTVSRVYVVRSGDNLTRLARRLHHSVAWLKAANHLRSSTIVVGQHLAYGQRVVTTRQRAGSAAVSVPVARSAARHRAVLRSRAQPSKTQVRALIRAAARRHGVPVSLALALSYQESGFQQRVVSPVDAIGAMQVLPSTGRYLGRAHGRTFDLLKARDNVEAGVWLIHDLLQATGSVPRTLAGYYQGLGSVNRIGLLPQTQAYIKNITLLQRRFA